MTPEVLATFRDKDEEVMVCCLMQKLRQIGLPDKNSERSYVQTTSMIYCFRKKGSGKWDLTRSYPIRDIGCVLVSSENKTDFFLHFPNPKHEELHLRLTQENRQ